MHGAHPHCHPESRLQRDKGSRAGSLSGDPSIVPHSGCNVGLPQNDTSFSVNLKAGNPLRARDRLNFVLP